LFPFSEAMPESAVLPGSGRVERDEVIVVEIDATADSRRICPFPGDTVSGGEAL
jgi:hypothetical protein